MLEDIRDAFMICNEHSPDSDVFACESVLPGHRVMKHVEANMWLNRMVSCFYYIVIICRNFHHLAADLSVKIF